VKDIGICPKPSPIPPPVPALSDSERLIELEKECRLARELIADAQKHLSRWHATHIDMRTVLIDRRPQYLVNALTRFEFAEVRQLEHELDRAARRHSELLAKRAALLKGTMR